MKSPFLHFIPLAVGALALAGCATTEPSTGSGGPAPAPGTLQAPGSASQRAYLGLSRSAGSPFKLNDIQADVLVVIGFDMYCHVCQNEAPRMVRIARAIETKPGGGRVKVIGLGIGDTPMETATFASKFGLPFPVFPDRSNAVAKSIATPVRVPSVMVLKRAGSGFRLVDRKAKIPADADAFAGEIVSHL